MIPLRKTDPVAQWVEQRFGHVFARPALCHAALTHRSAGADHNERLEFLGDALLNCGVARLLYDAHPDVDEGSLSRFRAALVSGETLAEIAGELELGQYLRLGSGELQSGGFRRASILADALEAMIGAIFLDAGYDAASAAVQRLLAARLAALPAAESLKDAKTLLQEILQEHGIALPAYTLREVSGEPHALSFTAGCEIAALGLSAAAEGPSRRRAEQLAAARILDLLPGELRK